MSNIPLVYGLCQFELLLQKSSKNLLTECYVFVKFTFVYRNTQK